MKLIPLTLALLFSSAYANEATRLSTDGLEWSSRDDSTVCYCTLIEYHDKLQEIYVREEQEQAEQRHNELVDGYPYKMEYRSETLGGMPVSYWLTHPDATVRARAVIQFAKKKGCKLIMRFDSDTVVDCGS